MMEDYNRGRRVGVGTTILAEAVWSVKNPYIGIYRWQS